ncbi:MAG TPA: carboxypeptidase regulatory-like domain-containing protein [Thermoanaerobaculia bacterium]|nr:carboxypeptidase regulatory-like domain-containing protein [Thermoanaerobaculia bacterium]
MKYAPLVLLPFLLFVPTGHVAAQDSGDLQAAPGPLPFGHPTETALTRAGSTTRDLRTLPYIPPTKEERPELEDPELNPVMLPGGPPQVAVPSLPVPVPSAPAPAPIMNFDGLDFANWGAGHPPDTVGDVGPVYYIQSINSSVGIYLKSTGVRVAAFTFNTFMSQGAFGNLCDTNNFGDPVILYDSFEDRWFITDFAFTTAGGAVVNPPGEFQCFAVSKTGDPVTGGWNYYSLNITDALGDYPKFGIWPDGIYMTANMFGFPAGGAFMSPRVWALNKAQMYAGAPTVQVVSFNGPSADFTILPSNARLQTGTPPPGTPNYFISTWEFLNALTVYKFHVDWTHISLSTFTGPDTPFAASSWPNAAVPNALSQGGNALDVLQIRAMMQNQYTNLGGVESLWTAHTVRRADTSGLAAPRWYQVDVTGGTVAANIPQASTWDPDGANVISRFMPSLALDRAGDMALGYSTSNSTTKPAIKYAGRLAGDPVNTLGQTEQLLFQGTGTQTGNCGAGVCIRWGDYSAMSLDPDGCTFWYTNEYYAVDGLNHQTRIGSFAFPSCTPVGAGGTLSGTVTATVGGAPIVGATLTLGARTTTTNGSGFYSFTSLPAGTYPSLTASAPGYNSSTVTSIVVTDGNTTTQNFSLATAPTSACPTDTTQADFQTGVTTNLDLTTSAGDAILLNAPTVDQSNTAGTTTGTSFGTASWGGQTFIPAVTGQLVKVDVQLFCNGCTGTTPNLTLSIRNTSGGLPTGADLATATIPGFSNGAGVYYTGSFGSPATLTSGTQYALILRPVATPSVGGYFWIRSSPSTYANGQRVISTDNGATWTADSTRDFNFKAYMQTGFAAAGNLVSSTKDSNPPVGSTSFWTTISWTATVPANTTLQFQVAGSNSATGPFNFVGPDTTAATFFTTSGASLSQFNGKRYLKYKAYLSTTDSTVTPTVNDVTVCFNVVAPDLAITKTDGVTTATPGGSVVYTITASNTTAAPATGATVADTFPASLTCTWTCSGTGGGTCTASGSGNINDSVNLPGSASVTYTATCTISAAATGTLANTATVTLATDPNTGNNSATDTDTLTPQSDLAITKTDGVTSATPGGSVTYTLTASNAGPSNAPGSTVADTFPASLTCTWTCVGAGGGTCTASGSGNLNDSANLPSGGSVTYTASCTISSAATGTLSNTATVTAPGGVTDPTPGNNSATDSDTLAPQADLAITKTDGVTTATPGGSVTYTLTASNAGPSDAPGSTVADTFPASLTCTWTCTGAGGGTCTASGSGNINDSADLPNGGSVTYTASCTIAASATGTLSNTATVTAPGSVTDPTPGNNSATDSDTLAPSADLAITKTDGVVTATPGGSVTYTIVASNAGPSDAPGSTVADTFPASLTCTWTCAGSGGGTCTASGSGDLNDTVNLPSGGSVTYTASCTISGAATGTLDNTATVAAPAGVTDPTPGNNSATDSDTLLAGLFYSVTPCRLLDTRNANGPYGGPPINALSTRTFVAAGQCGVPADATALSYNLTVLQGTAAGDLRVYSTGIAAPLVSVINYVINQVRANNGITGLGAAGDFVVRSDQPVGTVHIILDVNGYFR